MHEVSDVLGQQSTPKFIQLFRIMFLAIFLHITYVYDEMSLIQMAFVPIWDRRTLIFFYLILSNSILP